MIFQQYSPGFSALSIPLVSMSCKLKENLLVVLDPITLQQLFGAARSPNFFLTILLVKRMFATTSEAQSFLAQKVIFAQMKFPEGTGRVGSCPGAELSFVPSFFLSLFCLCSFLLWSYLLGLIRCRGFWCPLDHFVQFESSVCNHGDIFNTLAPFSFFFWKLRR